MKDYFISTLSEREIKLEKEKARALRQKQWWQTLINQGVCYYCSGTFGKDDLTMDHLIPIIRGGKSTKGNIVCACKKCNNEKKYMLLHEWEEEKKNKNTNDDNNV